MKINLPENSVVLSFDEKGRTPIKQYGGMKWTNENHYLVPYKQKVRGLFNILAVKNIHTKERHFRFYDWKNSFIVGQFFEWLSKKVYPGKTIYIILDNWRAHTSETLKTIVSLLENVKLVFLPKICSWMNEIERDFSRIQREVLDNSNYESATELMKAVSNFFQKVLNFS